jgi:hypothetical protein
MVPIANPAFLTLPDGRTLGEARPATRLDAQRLTPLPTRKPAGYRAPVLRVPWDGATEDLDTPQPGAQAVAPTTDTGGERPATGAAAGEGTPAAGTDASETVEQ